jgi:hypothetical protein
MVVGSLVGAWMCVRVRRRLKELLQMKEKGEEKKGKQKKEKEIEREFRDAVYLAQKWEIRSPDRVCFHNRACQLCSD